MLVVGLLSGEDSQEGNSVRSISINQSMSLVDSPSLISTAANAIGLSTDLVLLPPPPPPPPPSYFLGYHLPPGHPCNSFTLPPPPADKKRTGPRRKFLTFVYYFAVLPKIANRLFDIYEFAIVPVLVL